MGDLVDPKPNLDVDADVSGVYQPQDALGRSARSAMMTGAAGLFIASVQNTVAKEQIGAFGVFTRFGRTIGLLTAMGGVFQFTSIASANLREKNDFVNHTIGGALAGSLNGLWKRSMVSTLGSALALGSVMGVISYTGRTMFESAADKPFADRMAYKDEAKARFRRPLNETINELGEGRGIYGPGYEERRKQRIKERYGFDVQPPYYENKSAPGA
ncbi:hypothetical protein A1O7_06895 [Cladophialophora yegresii CBS 114405]|uniref:NADH dehydrogenase n=1 Tax=Cladophialophora yegresii CBS 114405 TaxID=1182544 RepID=W9VWF2_9EURO|nr:uncharacterized protein A1O7_06895 [Cladophialophora yegresii CBS 114405]EXJ56551.1 hypothetical protein A1O7_06895 [Cladophialophora yegresii CBS 114405]